MAMLSGGPSQTDNDRWDAFKQKKEVEGIKKPRFLIAYLMPDEQYHFDVLGSARGTASDDEVLEELLGKLRELVRGEGLDAEKHTVGLNKGKTKVLAKIPIGYMEFDHKLIWISYVDDDELNAKMMAKIALKSMHGFRSQAFVETYRAQAHFEIKDQGEMNLEHMKGAIAADKAFQQL